MLYSLLAYTNWHQYEIIIQTSPLFTQALLNEFIPKVAGNSQWSLAGPGIWIGFTLQAGDTWMWVNNVTLLGEG